MAIRLTDNAYVKGRYLDANVSVSSISELINKWDFDGQSVHMPNAFESSNGIPYPIDFWYTPYGDDIKWEIKTVPSLENEEDLGRFNAFIQDFKSESGYFPLVDGFELLVAGEKLIFATEENGEPIFKSSQDLSDEIISDIVENAVEEAVNKVTSGASEAFDTLQEIEAWINENSGKTGDLTDYVTKEELTDYAKKENIPSLDGYATENWVSAEIAKAQLSGGSIDPTIYATKEDIANLASKDEIRIYEGGQGTSIDNNKINIKIAEDTVEKTNFIEINDKNELELNTITLDAAVISEDIEVNGGEWADEVETVFSDGKVPAGITFEEFLRKMLKKEKFVTDFTVEKTFDVYCNNFTPTITYNDKDANEQIIEVGAKINIGAIEAPSTHAVQTISAGTYTYGYKVGEDGEYVKSVLYTEKLRPTLTQNNSKLQMTFTNICDEEGNELSNIYLNQENGDEVTVGPFVGYVRAGHNSVTINYTGDTYNTNVFNKEIYVATSLQKYYMEDEVTPNVHNISFEDAEKTATVQFKCQFTGAHKYFVGGINEYSKGYWDSNRSDEVRGLENKGWANESTITVPYTFKSGTKQQVVAVPSEYTKVEGRDLLNGPVTFNLVKSDMNFYNVHGYTSKYNIFVAPVYDGLSVDSFINITISK